MVKIFFMNCTIQLLTFYAQQCIGEVVHKYFQKINPGIFNNKLLFKTGSIY